MESHLALTLLVISLMAPGGAPSSPELKPPSELAPFCDAEGRRGELDIYGAVSSIAIAPNGRIWIPTRTGRTYYTEDVLGDWRAGALDLSSDDEVRTMSQTIDRISFFNNDIAFASGYISSGNSSVEDTIYRTVDGGASWSPLHFPGGEWIYSAFVTPGGKAWMGGSSGSFLYSSDFAASWTLRSSPFKKDDARTHAIFMTDSGTGVVGSLRNAIKLTSDNGGSWRSIPTPLDQKAVDPGEDRGDHRIEKVAFFDEFLLAQQDGHVLVSSRKPIAWHELAPALVDFAVDPAARTFVGLTASLDIVEFGANLAGSAFGSGPLAAFPQDLVFANGALFVFDSNRDVYEIRGHVTRGGRPLTSSGPRAKIRVVRNRDELLWGTSGGQIYNSNDQGRSWCRRAPTGGTMVGFEIRPDGHLLLWDGHGKNVEFDPGTREVKPLALFGSDDIVRIVPTDGLWVAYGGMQYETTRRIEVARTYFSGQFHGSVDHGFVYVSDDSGITWKVADRWNDGGVANLFVATNKEICELSYLGAVRKLVRGEAGWTAETLMAATPATVDKVPYVERAFAFYFADAAVGFVAGWIHHIGNRYFKTTDGGRSWTPIDEQRFPYSRVVPFRGSSIAVKGRSLGRLQSFQFTPIDVSKILASNEVITDLSVDGKGRLLIEMTPTGKYEIPDGASRWKVLDLPSD
jgi:photosystem II stability/assembly factor-like uncharacterized protein